MALDAGTGEKLWTAALGPSDWRGGGGAGTPDNKGGDGPRSTPSTDGKHVFVYDAHLALSCIDAASGKLVWKRDVLKEFAGRNIKWHNATSPLLDGDRIYVGGGGAGQSFLAFSKSGDLIWKSGDEEITHATPTLTEIDGKKQIIFFVQSGLVSLEPESGEDCGGKSMTLPFQRPRLQSPKATWFTVRLDTASEPDFMRSATTRIRNEYGANHQN